MKRSFHIYHTFHDLRLAFPFVTPPQRDVRKEVRHAKGVQELAASPIYVVSVALGGLYNISHISHQKLTNFCSIKKPLQSS